MPRIPYMDLEQAGPKLRESFGRLDAPANVFRMLAHAETCFDPMTRLGGAILGRQQLDARLRELALVYAMKLQGGRYEYSQHVPVALALGTTTDQLAAVEALAVDAECFDLQDKAVLRFTREVVEKVGASAEALGALRQFLPDRQIVELIVMIGYYMTLARLTETLDVEDEPSIGGKLLEAAQRRQNAAPR